MFSSNATQVSSANYIEDVFSTYLYTGNGSTQTITNGIDLSTKGGLVWLKQRNAAGQNTLFDTARGAYQRLRSDTTEAQVNISPNGLTSFDSSGFSLSGTSSDYNGSSDTYASWTFREQPKFFDVVTYTGTGSAQNISHNLGSVPGCIIVKCTNAGGSTNFDWAVYHTSQGSTKYLRLNTTAAVATGSALWNNTDPTSTQFTVGSSTLTNTSGGTYVAYLFAHDAGGFGLTGTDNVISCGSFTTNGSGQATITLAYEPQWLLVKRSDSTGNWFLVDNMRGFTVTNSTQALYANLSNAEVAINTTYFQPNSTGFFVDTGGASQTYIYIAIRRGPMKVPTSGTSVFSPTTYTGNGATGQTITSVGFPLDFVFDFKRATLDNKPTLSRLTANNALYTNLSDAQNPLSTTAFTFAVMDGFKLGNSGDTNSNGTTYIAECFRRAPSFFDEVCYNGTSATTAFNHNLSVAPELIIVKRRNGVATWPVGTLFTASTCKELTLDTTNSATNSTYSDYFGGQPTSTTFTMASSTGGNLSGSTYVAYLFASCPGVSKVGSYTGTGTSPLSIDCGFTGGARFVMIKRTDSTGDWYVWDTARGMVSGTDPYLLLNSTAAETNTDRCFTATGGFQVINSSPSVNAVGGTYIYLAIA